LNQDIEHLSDLARSRFETNANRPLAVVASGRRVPSGAWGHIPEG